MNEMKRWSKIENFMKIKFNQDETPDLNTIIFLIGLQEFGGGYRRYKKDDKMNLIHIAVCRLLEPFGYYKFDKYDDDGWPHYITLEELPDLKSNEQMLLIKKAIIQYFEDEKLIEDF
ncbi:hypothetical protein ETU09_08630 [Apibacter muscae]|uniref:Uncharacterized protein n=2 Tax=Apibacter muscae TaxID=2509004 RepID=A0A563D8M0_9FLAO|nr:hypothetical protein ETU09_08630 [Apibacter muscae]